MNLSALKAMATGLDLSAEFSNSIKEKEELNLVHVYGILQESILAKDLTYMEYDLSWMNGSDFHINHRTSFQMVSFTQVTSLLLN